MDDSHFRQSMALLGERRFGTFWLASLLANMGTWAQQVAQPWLLLSLGASPFILGLDAFALGAPVLLVLAGVAMTASNASANALLQSTAPARIRAQTVSLFMLCVRGGMALGSLFTGATVHLVGVREALLLNGLLAVLAQLAIGRTWMTAPTPR